MSEWIKCADKLPELNVSVLLLAGEGINQSQYVAWIEKLGMEDKPCWQYSWCCGCYVNEKATHWQPLPEPPHD